MTQVPILAEGDASSALTWADVVANAVNKSVLGGDAIIEMATTPAGTQANEIRWSSVHQALMRWTGTQWIFAGGRPGYFSTAESDFMLLNVAGTIQDTSGGTFGIGGVGSIVASTTMFNGHPGALAISSTTGGTNRGGMIGLINSVGAALPLPGACPGLRYRAVFQVPASGAVATVTQRLGLHDGGAGATAPVNGAFLEIVNLTGSFKTVNNSTTTTNGTTVTLVGGTWYTLHIWFTTATQCRCVLIKDDGTVALDVTNTTNAPDGTRVIAPQDTVNNTANMATTLLQYLDYMGAGYAPV